MQFFVEHETCKNLMNFYQHLKTSSIASHTIFVCYTLLYGRQPIKYFKKCHEFYFGKKIVDSCLKLKLKYVWTLCRIYLVIFRSSEGHQSSFYTTRYDSWWKNRLITTCRKKKLKKKCSNIICVQVKNMIFK